MASSISAGTTSSTALVATADTTGALQLATNNGTVAVTIDTSQNVGIGTTVNNVFDQVAAARPLVVQKSDTSTTLNGSTAAITIVNGNTTTNNTAQLNFAAITGASTSQYSSAIIACTFGARTNGQYPTGILTFSTSTTLNSAPTEKMRIDSSGNVLVGTTSATGIGLTIGNQAANSGVPYLIFNKSLSGAVIVQYFNFNGSGVGSIQCTDTSTSYVTSSDYRLKEDIALMTGALAKVAQLKPVTYKWKSNGANGEGFIAHELAEVCPEAVAGVKDAVDADGNIISQGIDTSFLVATLTAAIQEQQALITQQAAAIEALTTRITALEGTPA